MPRIYVFLFLKIDSGFNSVRLFFKIIKKMLIVMKDCGAICVFTIGLFKMSPGVSCDLLYRLKLENRKYNMQVKCNEFVRNGKVISLCH